jgi:hypothetical protein
MERWLLDREMCSFNEYHYTQKVNLISEWSDKKKDIKIVENDMLIRSVNLLAAIS